MHPAYDGLAALPFYDEFDLSQVDVLLISQYVPLLSDFPPLWHYIEVTHEHEIVRSDQYECFILQWRYTPSDHELFWAAMYRTLSVLKDHVPRNNERNFVLYCCPSLVHVIASCT